MDCYWVKLESFWSIFYVKMEVNNMAMKRLARLNAQWVVRGSKKFAHIHPETLQIQVYEILENMLSDGKLTEDELNDLLEAE